LIMVATGSLSSKNPASISELLDRGYHPGSLLSGEWPSRLPTSVPSKGRRPFLDPAGRRACQRFHPLPEWRGCYKTHRKSLSKLSVFVCQWETKSNKNEILEDHITLVCCC
jgi:hypothetical protein